MSQGLTVFDGLCMHRVAWKFAARHMHKPALERTAYASRGVDRQNGMKMK